MATKTATKTYDYAVIYNGVLYPANTPIEVKKEKKVVANDKNGTGTEPETTDRAD